MSAVGERLWHISPADGQPPHGHRQPTVDPGTYYEQLTGELTYRPPARSGRHVQSRPWVPDDLVPTDVLPAIRAWPQGEGLTLRQREALLSLRQAAQEVMSAFAEHPTHAR
ncbi:hypothetical protein [Nonomuraea dietziae]|uniref:Uncharacterized protein n=1 Tax=Nonomuraea dietziae TaxID=65515 RepID=A0A7W5UYN1_9ACTN|nr:hypothetical protein [Nonomuraea dietziae]MBB3724445.1 hypothetical protein [Nonomuraea dietziae]